MKRYMRRNRNDTAENAPIANAAEVEFLTDEDGTPSAGREGPLFRMWAGAYGDIIVYVWADSFESAFEELVEYLDDNAPGALVTLDEDSLKEAAEDEGIEWQEHWPDWEDPEFEQVVEAAEVDMTVIGHTPLKHGTHISSSEWGGDDVPMGDEWRTVYDRSLDEIEED